MLERLIHTEKSFHRGQYKCLLPPPMCECLFTYTETNTEFLRLFNHYELNHRKMASCHLICILLWKWTVFIQLYVMYIVYIWVACSCLCPLFLKLVFVFLFCLCKSIVYIKENKRFWFYCKISRRRNLKSTQPYGIAGSRRIHDWDKI